RLGVASPAKIETIPLGGVEMESGQIEAERDGLDLRRRGDPQPDEVVTNLVRHGDEPGGRPRQPALALGEEPRPPWREVAGQHVPVKCVDANRWRGVAGQDRGEPADGAGLGHVGVEHIRPDPAYGGGHRHERTQVTGPELPPEAPYTTRPHA